MKRIIALLCLVNCLNANIDFNKDDFEQGIRTEEQKKCEDALKKAMDAKKVKEAASIFAGTKCSDFFGHFLSGSSNQENGNVKELLQTTDGKVAQQVASVMGGGDSLERVYYCIWHSSPVVMGQVLQQYRQKILNMPPEDLDGSERFLFNDITRGRSVKPNVVAFLEVALAQRHRLEATLLPAGIEIFTGGVGPTALLFKNQTSDQILKSSKRQLSVLQRMMEETLCTVDRYVRASRDEKDVENAKVQMQEREESLKQVIRFCGKGFFTQTFKRNYLYWGNNVDTVTHFDDLLYFHAQQLNSQEDKPNAAQSHVVFLNDIKAMRQLPEDAIVLAVDKSQTVTMWQGIIEGLLLEDVVSNILIPMMKEKRGSLYESDDTIGALHDIVRCAREYEKKGRMTENIIKGLKQARKAAGYKSVYDKETHQCVSMGEEEQILKNLIEELEWKDNLKSLPFKQVISDIFIRKLHGKSSKYTDVATREDTMVPLHDIAEHAREYKKLGTMTDDIMFALRHVIRWDLSENDREERQVLEALITELEKEDNQ